MCVCVNSSPYLGNLLSCAMITYKERSLHEMISILHTRTGGMVKLEAIIVEKAKNH